MDSLKKIDKEKYEVIIVPSGKRLWRSLFLVPSPESWSKTVIEKCLKLDGMVWIILLILLSIVHALFEEKIIKEIPSIGFDLVDLVPYLQI